MLIRNIDELSLSIIKEIQEEKAKEVIKKVIDLGYEIKDDDETNVMLMLEEIDRAKDPHDLLIWSAEAVRFFSMVIYNPVDVTDYAIDEFIDREKFEKRVYDKDIYVTTAERELRIFEEAKEKIKKDAEYKERCKEGKFITQDDYVELVDYNHLMFDEFGEYLKADGTDGDAVEEVTDNTVTDGDTTTTTDDAVEEVTDDNNKTTDVTVTTNEEDTTMLENNVKATENNTTVKELSTTVKEDKYPGAMLNNETHKIYYKFDDLTVTIESIYKGSYRRGTTRFVDARVTVEGPKKLIERGAGEFKIHYTPGHRTPEEGSDFFYEVSPVNHRYSWIRDKTMQDIEMHLLDLFEAVYNGETQESIERYLEEETRKKEEDTTTTTDDAVEKIADDCLLHPRYDNELSGEQPARITETLIPMERFLLYPKNAEYGFIEVYISPDFDRGLLYMMDEEGNKMGADFEVDDGLNPADFGSVEEMIKTLVNSCKYIPEGIAQIRQMKGAILPTIHGDIYSAMDDKTGSLHAWIWRDNEMKDIDHVPLIVDYNNWQDAIEYILAENIADGLDLAAS